MKSGRTLSRERQIPNFHEYYYEYGRIIMCLSSYLLIVLTILNIFEKIDTFYIDSSLVAHSANLHTRVPLQKRQFQYFIR